MPWIPQYRSRAYAGRNRHLRKKRSTPQHRGLARTSGFARNRLIAHICMDFERILSVASALEPEKAPVRPICVLAGKFILFHLAEVSHVLGDTQVPSPAFWGRGGLRGCRWEEAEAGGHVVPARGMHKSRESQIPDLLSTGE